jgi:lipoprotein signal peptidase
MWKGSQMGVLSLVKDLVVLGTAVSSLVVILGAIWKALLSINQQLQRLLDLRENRVLVRQHVAVEKAHAKGRAEGFAHCQEYWTALVCAVVLIFVFYYFAGAKSA